MITSCTKCGSGYDAQSEEMANEQVRLCFDCRITPLPWHIRNHWLTDSSELVTVAQFPIIEERDANGKIGKLQNRANAEFIRQAVNQQDQLIAQRDALLACLQEIELLAREPKRSHVANVIVVKAKAAIALCEPKEKE